MHWPLVRRKTMERALTEKAVAMIEEVFLAKTAELDARQEMERLSTSVGNAIGLHMAKPYREGHISGVTFPLFVSGYALQEMGKRMDERQLAELVANEARKATLALLRDPAAAVQLQQGARRG